MDRQLTDKEARFCHEYMVDMNATQAAIRAGYSVNSARQIGTENLSKPSIIAVIDELTEELTARTKVSAERVIQEYAKIAFSNITDIVENDPDNEELKTKHLGSLPASVKGAISKIKIKKRAIRDGDGADIGTETEIEVFMHDKAKALDSLSRHLGLFNDKMTVEQGANLSGLPFRELYKLKYGSYPDSETESDSGT